MYSIRCFWYIIQISAFDPCPDVAWPMFSLWLRLLHAPTCSYILALSETGAPKISWSHMIIDHIWSLRIFPYFPIFSQLKVAIWGHKHPIFIGVAPVEQPPGRRRQWSRHPRHGDFQRSEREAAAQRRKYDWPGEEVTGLARAPVDDCYLLFIAVFIWDLLRICQSDHSHRHHKSEMISNATAARGHLSCTASLHSASPLIDLALLFRSFTTCCSPKRWCNRSRLFRSGMTHAANGTNSSSRNSGDLGPMPQPEDSWCHDVMKRSWGWPPGQWHRKKMDENWTSRNTLAQS